jgi:hypothetical protein
MTVFSSKFKFVTALLFTAVLNNRLNHYLENMSVLCEEQVGFRKNYGTYDHIFNLICFVDLYLHRNKPLYCAFIDYHKVFDLHRSKPLYCAFIDYHKVFDLHRNKPLYSLYNIADILSCLFQVSLFHKPIILLLIKILNRISAIAQNITTNFYLSKNVKLRLCDQFKQKWSTVVFNSPKCLNYTIFKCNHGLEKYLLDLPDDLRKALCSSNKNL